MKKFYIFRNKDSGEAYVQALNSAGYAETDDAFQADFFLMDHEQVAGRREKRKRLLERGPGFIYPHTPLTPWLWDGIYQPMPMACNFQSGLGAVELMKAYGYPNRVEAVGFPRCEVLSFRPTTGVRLIFIPARPRKDKGRQAALDLQAFHWICDHRDAFESVTICHMPGQFDNYPPNFKDINFVETGPHKSATPAADMATRIDQADLVIAVTTPAALAVARGVPTVMYGQRYAPETITGQRVASWEKYRHIYAYPLDLECMNLEDVQEACRVQNSAVELWKEQIIGGNFNARAFLSVIAEYI